ncbi:MAG: lytic transglycosylase domain-containing protein [Pseudomonadota bacterium]
MKTKIFMFWGIVGAATLATASVVDLPETIIVRSDPEVVSYQSEPSMPEEAQDQTSFEIALSALAERDHSSVRRVLAQQDPGSIEHAALTWAFAHSGAMNLRELQDARTGLVGWPGDQKLQGLENDLSLTGLLGIDRIAKQLSGRTSNSFSTSVGGARAHLKDGDREAARKLLQLVWLDERLSANDEALILDEFKTVLTEEDHARRYFNMMSRDRVRSGTRLAAAANMLPLHDAWTALIRGQGSVLTMLEDVPASHRLTTAFKFVEVEALRKNGFFEQAAEALSIVSTDPDIAINPNAWWVERRIVSRSLREEGRLAEAYDIVAAHRGGTKATRIEARFHAGWYALQLGNPALATTHFSKISDMAQTPISKARGEYWFGRALEQLSGNKEEAAAAFKRASEHSTTFYGLLAAVRLGETELVAGPEHSWKHTDLSVIFADTLNLFDHHADKTVLRQFSNSLTGDEKALEHGLDAALWLNENGYVFKGLRMSKAAHRAGHFSRTALYPVDVIPSDDDFEHRDLALAHAIARQESEFRLDARSSADALGLMQLLPSTAAAEAERLGLAYQSGLLTRNADYNAKLGLSYVNRQLERFAGSYVLALIAYNAGPGRATQWQERFGSPVGLNLDETIDWIEQIPFPETRNYVFRVLENYAVYRSKYGLDGSLEDILVQGHPTY